MSAPRGRIWRLGVTRRASIIAPTNVIGGDLGLWNGAISIGRRTHAFRPSAGHWNFCESAPTLAKVERHTHVNHRWRKFKVITGRLLWLLKQLRRSRVPVEVAINDNHSVESPIRQNGDLSCSVPCWGSLCSASCIIRRLAFNSETALGVVPWYPGLCCF